MTVSARARYSVRSVVWRALVLSGGVLLAVAPFLVWMSRSIGLGAEVSFSLDGYSRAALVMLGAGVVISLYALLTSVPSGALLLFLAVLYVVFGIETSLSLVRSLTGGAGSINIGPGVVVAIAGLVVLLVGVARLRALNRLRGF